MTSFPLLRAMAFAALLLAQSLPSFAAIRLAPVVSAGLSNPVFVTNARDGSNRLFIVEQGGLVKVLQPGTSTPTVFLDLKAKTTLDGERGLLGLAFHPLFQSNGRFFVYYTRPSDGTIVVAEYRVGPDPNSASKDETVLLTIPHAAAANHNGGMLAFGPDGYLYVGVGDGGSGNDPPNNAQNINVLLGKILRIDVDHADPVAGTLYSSPGDNPYIGATPGRDEIYAIGFRNPWRFSFDRGSSGAMWVGDVGQDAREEVDTPVVKGGNYGWRVYEGTRCTGNDPSLCTPSKYLGPLFEYGHDGGRCAITGGYVYRGAGQALPAGTYVYGDYCTGEIFAWDGASQSLLADTDMSIASFGEDEQGELYVVDVSGGTISRIETPTPPQMVVEFYNQTLDHYFVTASDSEASGIDAGQAGPGWRRTGNTFKAGGPAPVCRFYGSLSPGPNSHFYTADPAECAYLKQLQATTPASQKRWNYETIAFSASLRDSGYCPFGTIPVYRAYNDGFARGIDSNHRLATNAVAIQEVVSRGWRNEGIVMCAPQ